MKISKIVFAIVIIFALLLVVFHFSEICPKYLDFMPRVVGNGFPEKPFDWHVIPYYLKLCPFTVVSY